MLRDLAEPGRAASRHHHKERRMTQQPIAEDATAKPRFTVAHWSAFT